MSTHEGHSAKELCEHDTSAGPDFVSMKEGLFCDMSEKKLWPLCDGVGGKEGQGNGDIQAISDNNEKREEPAASVSCFDTKTKTMRGAGPHRRDESIPVKQYENAEMWDETNMRL
ncbi:MAG: hypothetical protein Q9174_006859 [Haloplaca sp. 1 TL-2023]